MNRIDFGKFYMRSIQEGDVELFSSRMREADRIELKRWGGNTPLYELGNAVNLSEVLWVGCAQDGTLLSMFGGKHANILEETGVIWELSTEAVNENKLLFAKASKIGLDLVCKALPDVAEFYNYVDTEYKSAVKWIEWLGGSLTMDNAFQGRCGGVFKQFIISNPYYNAERGV